MVRSHIKHPLLRQAFSIHPLLVGGNPFSTTSIYCLIHYLERRWGVYFCMGGTGKIVSELYRLLERTGVNVVTNTDVTEIIIKNDRATGCRSRDGRSFNANRIICNADPPTVYSEMYAKISCAQKTHFTYLFKSILNGPLCVVFWYTKNLS